MTVISLVARLSFIVFLLSPLASYAKEYKVLLVPSSDSIIYTRTIDHIKKAINNTEVRIRTISHDELNTLNGTVDNNIDLIIPIGQHALKSALSQSGNYPVLATLITKQGFDSAINSSGSVNNKNNIGAIFLDQPISRNITFSRLALPGKKRLGFLMSKEFRKGITNFNALVKGYKYHLEIHNRKDNLIKSLGRVIRNSDVIIALPDSTIYNQRTTHNILLSTYRKFIPVIGFSRSYIKAGALAGIFSTPELIGKQTGEVIADLASSNSFNNLPTTYAKYFDVSVNNKVARSLGLPELDKDDLMKKLLSQEESSHD